MNAFQKTEAILYDYSSYKLGVELKRNYKHFVKNGTLSDTCVHNIEQALYSLKDNEWIDIITLYYFERHTIEQIAEIYGTSTFTVSINKKKLVNKLKTILFSDDAIRELMEL